MEKEILSRGTLKVELAGLGSLLCGVIEEG
jgi:hypothetical protein